MIRILKSTNREGKFDKPSLVLTSMNIYIQDSTPGLMIRQNYWKHIKMELMYTQIEEYMNQGIILTARIYQGKFLSWKKFSYKKEMCQSISWSHCLFLNN